MMNKEADELVDKGNELSDSGKYEEAIKCYAEATRLDPDNADIFSFWGNALSDLGNIKKDETLFREAFEKYDKAAQIEPDDADIFSLWGDALSDLGNIKQDESLFREAFEKYDKAAQIEPDDATIFYNWGHSIFKLANTKKDETLFRESFEKFDKAAQIQPGDSNIFCFWGNSLLSLANIKQDESLFREAFEKYDKTVQIKPNDNFVFSFWGKALSDLANIKRDETLFREAFEKYNKAAQIEPDDADIFCFWGDALSDLANIKQDESLFSEAIEKFDKAAQMEPDDALAFYLWGNTLFDLAQIKQDESLFSEAIEKYNKITQIKPDHASAFNNWGNVLSSLAQVKQDESLFSEAIEKYNKAAQLQPNDAVILNNWGLTLSYLARIIRDEDVLKKSFEIFYKETNSFKSLKKDILEIVVLFNNTNIKKIMATELFFPLLDTDTDDRRFVEETTRGITDKSLLDQYKKAYILSILIISQLHVNDENEKSVAHYREKTVSQKILLGISRFRLNAVNYSNDPTEGQTLLDYLFGENKGSAGDISNREYGAFAGCFIFDPDNLNQFRLYGKEDGKEGTGLSLVFKDSFFSEKAEMAMKQLKDEENKQKGEEKKYALFRCMYIDPVMQRVETVGRKEAYLFYREGKDKEIDDYNTYIKKVINDVSEEMETLQKIVKGLDPVVVGQLLINLRYLTKHIAFKEEQECRIIKICRLSDNNEIIPSNDFKQIYVEYEPKVFKHIEKIIFGPKAAGMELFQDILIHKGLNITCTKSKNPLT